MVENVKKRRFWVKKRRAKMVQNEKNIPLWGAIFDYFSKRVPTER